jgi:putative PIN family toxin of toxin-antitoxin system
VTAVVLDTNVLVSGVLSGAGPPGRIVEAVLAGEFVPVFDTAILDEYRDVLKRRELALSSSLVAELIEAIENGGTHLTVPPWPKDLPDADDAPFLAAAAAANCILVTGNLRHFPKSARGAVQVMSPQEFFDSVMRR